MGILVKNGYVVTLDNNNRVIKNGAVYIKNDKIVEVGESNQLEDQYPNAKEVIDANGRVVMPGLICSHMHFYSAFATGMPLPPFPKGFVNVLKNLWWKIDRALLKEDVYYSGLLGYIQAVRSGTTTVIDHHASPSYIIGSLDRIEEAGRKLGVRSNLCYEVTNRNSDEEAEEGLKENQRFIEKTQRQTDGLMSGSVGLHASFTLSDQSLVKAGELVDQLNSGVHIHVAEGKADMVDAKSKFNSTVLERLEKHNLLNEKSIVAHGIHVEDVDYSILKNRKPNIAHQPRSNMNNAVGTLDIWKLQESGISFGMGTDGMSSDMKAELMVGSLIHKHVKQDNTVGMAEVFNSLFHVNPQIVENVVGVETGQLLPSKKADILITGYYPKSPIKENNVMGHVMFGVINEPIHTTIIDGTVVMENYVIPTIDEREISETCQELAQDVWDRVTGL
ncbi:MAG: putative aminohydrolase SsnA [Candidatus Kariarchaeaceae archaeon]